MEAKDEVVVPSLQGAESATLKSWARAEMSGARFRAGEELATLEVRRGDGSASVEKLKAPFDLLVDSVDVRSGSHVRPGERVLLVERSASGTVPPPLRAPAAPRPAEAPKAPYRPDIRSTVGFRLPPAQAAGADAPLPREVRPGTRIPSDVYGEILVCEEIGTGASGWVYRCMQERSGQMHALKLFKDLAECEREWEACQLIRARCQDEIPDELVVLQHRERSDPRMTWMIFQAKGFRTLEAEIGLRRDEGARADPGDVIAFVRKMAQAVAMLHRMGLCHLDLKPRNVMVRVPRDGLQQEISGVRILDFTLCTPDGNPFPGFSRDLSVQLPRGTINYIPQRYFDEELSACRSIDVHSIAVMAYEYAYFEVPQQKQHLRLAEFFGNPSFEPLDRVLSRCLRQDIDNAEALLGELSALGRFVAKEAPAAETPGTRPPDPAVARSDRPAVSQLMNEGRAKRDRGLLEEARRCFQEAGEAGHLAGWAELAELLWRHEPSTALWACGEGLRAGRSSASRAGAEHVSLNRLRSIECLLQRDHAGLVDLSRAAVGATPVERSVRKYANLLRDFELLDDAPPKTFPAADRSAAMSSGLPWKIRHRASGIPLILVAASLRPARSGQAPLYLGETVVTQAEWKSAGVPLPPGLARAEDQLPVHGVSWFEASRFAQMLGFRLPTGDEWELAAWGGDGAADGMGVGPRHANVLVTPEGGLDARMLPASALEPLPTGFRQMFGNIWEWCADPESPDSAHRLRMGGSYRSRLEECLSRQRSYLDGHRSAYSLIGFRVAYTAP